MAIDGTAGSETILGTGAADEINFSQGGDDFVRAFGGDDTMFGGAALTAADTVNGGVGYDILNIQGNYSGGLTFGALTMTNVECLQFADGFNYAIAIHNANIEPGALFKVDAYFVGPGFHVLFDGSAELNADFLMYDGRSDDTFIGGAGDDNFSLSYDGADWAYGNDGGDVFNMGGALDNTDRLDGGAGNDVVHLADNMTLSLADGVFTSIENVNFNGDYAYDLTINDGNIAAGDSIFFDARGQTAAGHFVLDASDENDGSIAVIDGGGNDTVYGSQNADDIRGGAGTNRYFGNGGDDSFLLDDFDSTDWVFGGSGDDWLALHNDYSAGIVFEANTVVDVESIQLYDNGTDYRITLHDGNVNAGQTMRISSGTVNGNTTFIDGSAETDGILNLGGGTGNDTLIGGAGGDDISDQYGGNDRFYGNAGNDVFRWFNTFNAQDFIDGGADEDYVSLNYDTGMTLTIGGGQLQNVEAVTFGGGGDITVTALNSLLASNQTITIDAYYLDAGFTFTFNGQAETNGRFNLQGGLGDDSITGGAKSDTLNGGATGTDTLTGGLGDDFYDNTIGDVIVELAGGGTDTIRSDVTINISGVANVENLTLTGNNNINGTGNALDNYIYGSYFLNVINGGAGNDTIDGYYGADTLRGGTGDDTYYNPEAIDSLVENAGEGSDTVETAGSFSLLAIANIENITLLGMNDVDAIGNGLSNRLLGNSGANRLAGHGGQDTLDGGAGADVMRGGDGDDTYYVDNRNDKTFEDTAGAAGGKDVVHSTVSRAIRDNIEELHLDGSGNLRGIGNALDNRILGNTGNNDLQGANGADTLNGGAGDDTLRGGAGDDKMVGGLGNDRYYVDSANDQTTETEAGSGGGIDTVYSTVNRSLGANIENLRLQGAAVNGNGNDLGNKILGTSGDNRLQGFAGNDSLVAGNGADTLVGGEGNDTMAGGAGADVFRFTMTNAGADTIRDLNKNQDRFDLGGGSFTKAEVFGTDTILTHNGGTIRVANVDNLTLQQWNALVLPAGSSMAAASDKAASLVPTDALRIDPVLADIAAHLPQSLFSLSHADFL